LTRETEQGADQGRHPAGADIGIGLPDQQQRLATMSGPDLDGRRANASPRTRAMAEGLTDHS